MNFTKMQGTGNDFIIIEDFDNKYLGKEDILAKILCDRKFGIGGDGILIVRKSDISDIEMVIINSDGSYASMCGNGIRCFAKYVWDKDIVRKDEIKIQTGDGIKIAYMKVENNEVNDIKIYMGKPSYEPSIIPALSEEKIINRDLCIGNKNYKINTMLLGVPHTVIFGKLDDFNINEGAAIEKYSMFPQGTNVNFCEVISNNKVRVKTWERGAGPTLACGTGSCASVEAARRLKLVGNSVEVEVPGGKLFIEITDDGVYMTGPAVIVFEGYLKNALEI